MLLTRRPDLHDVTSPALPGPVDEACAQTRTRADENLIRGQRMTGRAGGRGQLEQPVSVDSVVIVHEGKLFATTDIAAELRLSFADRSPQATRSYPSTVSASTHGKPCAAAMSGWIT
jgi:hypothetical protein